MRLHLPTEQQKTLEASFGKALLEGAHADVREAEKNDEHERLDGYSNHPRFHKLKG